MFLRGDGDKDGAAAVADGPVRAERAGLGFEFHRRGRRLSRGGDVQLEGIPVRRKIAARAVEQSQDNRGRSARSPGQQRITFGPPQKCRFEREYSPGPPAEMEPAAMGAMAVLVMLSNSSVTTRARAQRQHRWSDLRAGGGNIKRRAVGERDVSAAGLDGKQRDAAAGDNRCPAVGIRGRRESGCRGH